MSKRSWYFILSIPGVAILVLILLFSRQNASYHAPIYYVSDVPGDRQIYDSSAGKVSQKK